MKKTKVISFILMLALIMSMSPFAFADNGGFSGDGDVTQVPLKIAVPSNLPFALMPFLNPETHATGQVVESAGSSLTLVNNTTGASVIAAFYLEVVPKADVTIAASSGALLSDLYTATTKAIAFGIVPASSTSAITVGAASMIADYVTGEAIYATTAAVYTTPPGITTHALDAGFLIPTGGKAGFSFTATMNAYANWAPNDITVKGVYLTKAVAEGDTNIVVSGGSRLIGSALPAKPDAPTLPAYGTAIGSGVTAVDNTAHTLTYTYSGNVTASTEIPFAFSGKAYTKAMVGSNVNVSSWFTATSNSLKLVQGNGTTLWDANPSNTTVTVNVTIGTDNWVMTIIKN